MTYQPMTCDRFDELLPDYLPDADGPATLDAVTRAAADSHLDRCDRCATLAAELTAIVREAAVLPPLRPERDLWAGIAERIEAPVVSLPGVGGETQSTVVPLQATTTGRREAREVGYSSFSRRWLGAAAAALVAVTAGVTYTATRTGEPVRSAQVADTLATPAAGPIYPAPAAPAQLATAADTGVARPDTAAERRAGSATPSSAAPVARLASDPRVAAVAPAAATYDREIAQMRRIVQQRRGELDPATVAVLERNMRLIDDAIAQSRAALARNPRSRFLGEQLERTLDQKLDLLRTVALLPRT